MKMKDHWRDVKPGFRPWKYASERFIPCPFIHCRLQELKKDPRITLDADLRWIPLVKQFTVSPRSRSEFQHCMATRKFCGKSWRELRLPQNFFLYITGNRKGTAVSCLTLTHLEENPAGRVQPAKRHRCYFLSQKEERGAHPPAKRGGLYLNLYAVKSIRIPISWANSNQITWGMRWTVNIIGCTAICFMPMPIRLNEKAAVWSCHSDFETGRND